MACSIGDVEVAVTSDVAPSSEGDAVALYCGMAMKADVVKALRVVAKYKKCGSGVERSRRGSIVIVCIIRMAPSQNLTGRLR